MKLYLRSRGALGLLAAVLSSTFIVGGTFGLAALMRVVLQSPRAGTASGVQASLAVVHSPLAMQGAKLFSSNCAHCHGIDATGDEGPDLHGLTKSDGRLKTTILNGVKGEMPAFNKKLTEQDATALVAFLRTLKG
jgi:mono/diheme cytochrome c family protein